MIFLGGGRVGGIRSFGTGMSVSFHPVEDINSIDTPKFVFHNYLKLPFSADYTGYE